jgi:hypothetical protein
MASASKGFLKTIEAFSCGGLILRVLRCLPVSNAQYFNVSAARG